MYHSSTRDVFHDDDDDDKPNILLFSSKGFYYNLAEKVQIALSLLPNNKTAKSQNQESQLKKILTLLLLEK